MEALKALESSYEADINYWLAEDDQSMADLSSSDAADTAYIRVALEEANYDAAASHWQGLDTSPREAIAAAVMQDLGKDTAANYLGFKWLW